MFKSTKSFKTAYVNKLESSCGKTLEDASMFDKYTALARLLRDEMGKKWAQTNNDYLVKDVRQVYYFSMEFLMGRLLGNNLTNAGIRDLCKEGLEELNIDINALEELESDPGLGNGGLGRLAACFLDSLASLDLPGHGCGIRYKYGLFRQKILQAYQVELPDDWLKNGYPWEFRKPDKALVVKFGGQVVMKEQDGKLVFSLHDYEPVLAVPYDIPIPGYKNETVNTLRLFSAEAVGDEFDFSDFSKGYFRQAVDYKNLVESISEILYPDDTSEEGKRLRLKQEYFMVSAGIQSILRFHKKKTGNVYTFAEKKVIHINDTHPTLVIPELMRILMDEEGMGWDDAWKITSSAVSYTNHTILPEALEKWPEVMMKTLLPRIYEIICEINNRFCKEIEHRYQGNREKIAAMSIVSGGNIHMANLAVVGSHKVNGVAKLHTEILKRVVMKDLYELYPYKFSNKTNGVTHRRWLLNANTNLANLLEDTISSSWIEHPDDLRKLEDYAYDKNFQDKFAAAKLGNKEKLAKMFRDKYNVNIDPSSIFDVQVKRIHAYKRQLMNIFHVIYLYNRMKNDSSFDIHPRTFIFAGKAAPGYQLAKRIIKLINEVAYRVNNDPSVKGRIKVVFSENYSVSTAEVLIPAADVSEQISTASQEASGTGNMKFMMNGAVTIGTLDGANVEILYEVGDENIFVFGMHATDVLQYNRAHYDPWKFYNEDERIKEIMDQLQGGYFGYEFEIICSHLMQERDPFFVFQDFDSYVNAQQELNDAYWDRERWLKMSIYNTAFSGFFSTDRTINEYAVDIWKIEPFGHRSYRKTIR